MGSSNKNRTSSRCSEWERNRRNKFNHAISRLWEIVKTISNASNTKDSKNNQHPKIEIIEKAILCLTNCAQEKTQLEAEIVALQVKLETEKNSKQIKKDASTQVYIHINKRSRKTNIVKLLIGNKPKHKSHHKLVSNADSNSKKLDSTCSPEKLQLSAVKPLQSYPKLLPRTSVNNKTGPDNTIVVVPATPYIFPPRPLLLPTVPPAFLLVDSLQSLSKSVPAVNRSCGDVTKTTTVNILPITAYSRPLSAIKDRKRNSKQKNEISRKVTKSSKLSIKENIVNKDSSKIKNIKKQICNDENISHKNSEIVTVSKEKNDVREATIKVSSTKTNDISTNAQNNEQNDKNSSKEKSDDDIKPVSPKCIELPKPTNISSPDVTSVVTKPVQNTSEKFIDTEKNHSNKEPLTDNKNKENKLPSILDTTLCENTVYGGNARLELAEELLAASPTAAFLMSFPLVSGNRAESPSEDNQNTTNSSKDNTIRRHVTCQSDSYYDKCTDIDNKTKSINKSSISPITTRKENEQDTNVIPKEVVTKPNIMPASNVSVENPFLTIPMPSLVMPSSCTLSDPTFGLDFECNMAKSTAIQTTANNSNIFYKSDPFSSVKSTIYSTSTISSGHEFNSIGLYPCAMEKYTSKTKSDYTNVEDNLMKFGSSRLTYDIDLGWSQKSFDFVSCTNNASTFSKDNTITSTAVTYSTSYNPFNPEFHVPFSTSMNKKEHSTQNSSSSFADNGNAFYSQPTTAWPEDVSFYNNNKTLTTKDQHCQPTNQSNVSIKHTATKHYDTKQLTETAIDNRIKSSHVRTEHSMNDKYNKKSGNKMHINWMTSEIRPIQNNCNTNHSEMKDINKPSYDIIDHVPKKSDHTENNYFPISIHNYSSQANQEDFQVWPPARPLGTTEITIEPPPINLPTLVGDLALGPHDRKKNGEVNRGILAAETQNCSNFLSVTQLMNRTADNVTSRYGTNIDLIKAPTKQDGSHYNATVMNNIKPANSRLDLNLLQPCYSFNNSKPANSYDNINHNKSKSVKSDKTSKVYKNSYSAEALIRGGVNCTQKVESNNSSRLISSHQKYSDFTSQDTGVAHVSHFPQILDYSDNTYSSQQFVGTTLYNSTPSTISNSFYSNFMPGSGNLMSGNYSNAPFTSDYIDYNNQNECNYTNNKYEELKIRSNPTVFHPDKVPSNYKTSRRESAVKHKLECSKKDISKKYQSKRVKANTEAEEWSDTSHWHNKTAPKRNATIMDELPYPNYVGNQMSAPTQYHPEYFNSHLIPPNVQSVNQVADRSFSTFPITSRANFNLSTIFPEITMKVQ